MKISSDKFVKIAEQANFTARFQVHNLPYVLGAILSDVRNTISKVTWRVDVLRLVLELNSLDYHHFGSSNALVMALRPGKCSEGNQHSSLLYFMFLARVNSTLNF